MESDHGSPQDAHPRPADVDPRGHVDLYDQDTPHTDPDFLAEPGFHPDPGFPVEPGFYPEPAPQSEDDPILDALSWKKTEDPSLDDLAVFHPAVSGSFPPADVEAAARKLGIRHMGAEVAE